MHKIIVNNEELELVGQEDYQVDNLLFLEFTTKIGIEKVNEIFSKVDHLLEIKIELDEAERIYKNYCVFKQLQYTNDKETPTYRITLEQKENFGELKSQIIDLQLAMTNMFEMIGDK